MGKSLILHFFFFSFIICHGDFIMNKKFFFNGFIFLLFCLFLFVGYLFINHKIQEDRFYLDIQDVLKQNFFKQISFDKHSVSGEYFVVENKIENYLSDIYQQSKIVSSYGQDPKIKTLLSVSNYLDDGPLFHNSISYIKEQQKSFNKDLEIFLSYFKKSYINSYISNSSLSKYYQNLFIESFFHYGIYSKLENIKESFLISADNLNQIYSVSLEIFQFLNIHSSDWKIEGEEIQFSTEELVDQYETLTSQIK